MTGYVAHPEPVTHVREGWSRGELRVQRCACGHMQFPPRAICLVCRSSDLRWETVPPRGTIVTFTVVHRAPTPVWKTRVPYAIALVDLLPGVRLMMNVDTGDPEALAVGMAVEIGFATADDDAQPRPIARPTAIAPAG